MYIISPVQGLIDYSLQPHTPVSIRHQRSCSASNCASGSLESGRSSSSKSKELPKEKKEKKKKKDKKSKGKELAELGGRAQSAAEAPHPSAMEGMKTLAHPNLWPNIKQHVATSLAIIKNLTDFAQELSQMYEHHAEELQLLVGNYRKKNAELRKERGASSCMLHVWDSLLQEVEADSQAHSEIASVLGRQVSRHTLERTFHRKLQARKLLAHRESLDVVITKAEETLSKSRQEYRAAYANHLQSPQSSASLSAYLDAHNSYVTQLHATNAMVETYSKETLPDLLQELEDVYTDLCHTMSESVSQGAEIISNRTGAQSRRYCNVWSECKDMDPTVDTSSLIRSLVIPAQPHPTHRLRLFTPPQHENDPPDVQVVQLKNELVSDRLASLQFPERYDSLCEEASSLHQEIQHIQDALSTMLRIQQRSLESSLFNKANELQEDISVKRYELKSAQLNLAAIQAQKELFAVKLDASEGGSGADRKMSSASTASMKSKWLKAFKSLKTSPTNEGKDAEKDKRNGKDMGMVPSDSAHQFQEYTYKKITPCDVCSQVLRGHTRQGLKCRLCKLNVHIDCQERVGKCQTKSRLLRRQKSSSEIETAAASRMNPPGSSTAPPGSSNEEQGGGYQQQQQQPQSDGIDSTYRVLKAANEISAKGAANRAGRNHHGGPQALHQPQHHNQQHPQSTSSDYSHGNPSRRRRLFGGMRSFSVFGQKSHDRAASLPETEQVQYAAGTRPFGQPLVLGGGGGGTGTGGGTSSSAAGSPPQTPKRRGH